MNYDFVGRRVRLEVLAVVGQGGEIVALDVVQAVGERHVPSAVVMAVDLPVGGHVQEGRSFLVYGDGSEEKEGEEDVVRPRHGGSRFGAIPQEAPL